MPHIIPFAGRHYSGPVTQNLLWRDGKVFLMDNHRAALWCWQQAVDLYSQSHSLLHIDRHYDALRAGVHVRKMPDLRALSASSYLADMFTLPTGGRNKICRKSYAKTERSVNFHRVPA